MLADNAGTFRLFRVFGVTVYLHWSWLAVAYIQYLFLRDAHLLEHFALYGSLFGIVLLHEFGHALACRSVGGRAEKIILWPLGGIAFVQPPRRPGAVLWSIAAGPLVNLVLVPVTVGLVVGAAVMLGDALPALQDYLYWLTAINAILLAFNMLPIYPLDGGQIVQALLWFFVGYTRSLLWSAWFGLICAVLLGVSMLWIAVSQASEQAAWLVVMALFVGWQSWRGIVIARTLAQYEQQWGQSV
ncbi:MAG: site-2 protease family protein [Phycisphaeraceae bacterium]|nr:site-2 protease family protein [Phycisphaeraceae bacterium]